MANLARELGGPTSRTGDPEVTRRMGEEGLRRAYRHYTWRSVASQAAAVHASVLHEHRAGGAAGLPTL